MKLRLSKNYKVAKFPFNPLPLIGMLIVAIYYKKKKL